MRLRLIVLVILGMVLCVGLAAAQEAMSCPAIVETALQSLDTLCQGAARNQACYGHPMLVAEAQPDATDFQFDTPGDITAVSSIRALRLQPLDEAESAWGVALMKLQANLPDTLPGQNVTVLLFGDVALQPATVERDAPLLQAFYFQTGFGASPCQEVPNSGILIQTPKGDMSVDLQVNEVSVVLGSTVFVRTGDSSMVLGVVEGHAQVAAFDVTRIVSAGAKVNIPLDENGAASGPPGLPVSYTEEDIRALPVNHLPEAITLAPPLTTAGCSIVASNTVNLRQGPGTDYPRDGTLAANNDVQPIGQALGSDGFVWWFTPCQCWVRSDVVTESGNCDALPVITDLPPAPPPAQRPSQPTSATANAGQIDNRYVIQMCAIQEPADGPLLAGQRVHLSIGVGGWPSMEAAEAALVGKSAIITVDGVTLPNFTNPIHIWAANDSSQAYVTSAVATWIATSGTHTIHGEWPGVDAPTREGTCVVTIE